MQGMETLSKLFGGQARVRIMRLFLLNSESNFEIEEIVSRSRVMKNNTRKEINILATMNFIKQKVITKDGYHGIKKKVVVWSLNPLFQYLEPMREILVDPSLLIQENLPERFKQVGKIKLMIVSGVFIGNSKSRADVLIVGDKLKKNVLQQVIKSLEAEIGKELDYVVFDTEEFKYRIDMYDKLICDIIDLPHEKLIDNGQLSAYVSKNN